MCAGEPEWQLCTVELLLQSMCVYSRSEALVDAMERLRVAELVARTDASETIRHHVRTVGCLAVTPEHTSHVAVCIHKCVCAY